MPSTKEFHISLAEYFRSKPLWFDEENKEKPNIRKLAEQPWQQTKAEKWDELEKTLCDLWFLDAKVMADQLQQLQKDYDFALTYLPESQKEKEVEIRRQQRIKKYTEDLIAYAKEEIKELDIISSIEPWSEEKIRTENDRIKNNPTRFDKIKMFQQFVESQFPSLKIGQIQDHYCIQHAFNYADSSPLVRQATKILNENSKAFKEIRFLLERSSKNIFNISNPVKTVFTQDWIDIESISVTPDLKIMVTGCPDKKIHIWDINKGICIRELEGHNNWVHSVSISADGKKVISGDSDGTVRIWNLSNGQCAYVFKDHLEPIGCVCISADGKVAISGSYDKTIRVWDLTKGLSKRILNGHSAGVRSLAMTPDGKTAISVSDDKTIRIWDLITGVCKKVIDILDQVILSITLTPNGKKAFYGSLQGHLYILDVEDGRVLKKLDNNYRKTISVCISHDGKFALTGDMSGPISVWDLDAGIIIKEINETWVTRTNSINISPDFKTAISVNHEVLCFWDINKGASFNSTKSKADNILKIKIISSKNNIVCAAIDNIEIWNSKTESIISTIPNTNLLTNDICITPDEKMVITVGKRINFIDFSTSVSIEKIKVEDISSIILSPDGRFAFTGSTDGSFRTWDVENFKCLKLDLAPLNKITNPHISDIDLMIYNEVHSMAIVPDGKIIFTGCGNGIIKMLEIPSGECLHEWRDHKHIVTSLNVSTDGRFLVSGSYDESIAIWEFKNKCCIKTFKNKWGRIITMQLTPDGKKIIFGTLKNEIIVLDIENGNIEQIHIGNSRVECLNLFSSDKIIYSTNDGKLRFLNSSKPLFKDPPAITPMRIWRFGVKKGSGNYDANITIQCWWCGKNFIAADDKILLIEDIYKQYNIDRKDSACTKLPEKAWDTPGLETTCPHCKKPLKINPFIVDNMELK